MKRFFKYMACLAVTAAGAAALSACQDDFDDKVAPAPEASQTATLSILDLKKTFWKDANNYIWGMEDTPDAVPVPIGTMDDGTHYIISGRVVSSDEQSNVFKSLVIQDETAALAISVNSYNLYLNYRVGQEVVIDVTGMYVGKYNGLLQLGYPEWYESGKVWEASFMSPEFFKSHCQLNGWPEAAAIDTLTVNSFSELPTNPDGLCRFQSQLVRFNNVHFVNGGKETFATYKSSGVNQVLEDAEGGSINVRTSGYATFWNNKLPEGSGDVVGILSYYGTSGWQLILNDLEGCMNFGNPTVAPGSGEDNPWSVDLAIAQIETGATTSGWTTGYIVGAVGPAVENISGIYDIEWTANALLDFTLVIGQTADTKDLANSLVVELPQGSKLRELGNLVQHPENYGKQIWIKGVPGKVMSAYGITGNNGSVGSWKIDGVETGGGSVTTGDGTEANPFSAGQVISGAASGTAWVKGYIVGSSAGMTAAEMTNATGSAASASNIFIADTPDQTDYTKCVPVKLPAGEIRDFLNLQAHPENLGQIVAVRGSIETYFKVNGVKSTTDCLLNGKRPGQAGPGTPVTSIDEGFLTGSMPAGWTSYKLQGDKAWYFREFPENSGNYYAAMTGYKGTAPFDSWLVTPGIEIAKCENKTLTFETQVNGYGSTTTTFEVYVMDNADPAKATTKTKLNATFATAPASGYSSWVASGNLDLSGYSGVIYIGWRYAATQDANYATWCVDNVKLNAGGDTPDPGPGPDVPADDYKGNFNSFNGGEAKSSPYGTYTNATGWTLENGIILGGSDDASAANPYFTFIGKKGTLAPTLNGRADKLGKLISPVLTGGCKTLTFDYGFAFSDTKCAFSVTVKDASGNVVKEDKVELTTLTTKTAYHYSLDVNVTGDFTVEIANLGLGGVTSGNKERVSIWNLTWTN